jgi:peptidoglycan hydrolase-like protein with peptidoglycan-binding domain
LSRCRLLAVGAALGAAVLPIAAPADAHAGAFGSRTLHMGMRGHDVHVLQRYLSRVGVSTTADGEFGVTTKRHVRRWERRSERRADGRVTRRDARALQRQVRRHAATTAPRDASTGGAQVPPASTERATVTSEGKAIAPSSAPAEVREVIDAANRIVGKPYRYGGGHGSWNDSGYDCSGSVSYALHGAGLVSRPMTSGEYESFGAAGRGTWITTYANGGHVFMVVAGLRFDTGWNNAGHGPRWSDEMRPSDGFVVRHPRGL